MRPTVAVLIPALNEAATLPGLLTALAQSRADRVIVVDNGSTDATSEVARAHGATVVSEPERGYGAACLAGIAQLASQDHPDVLVFLDADHAEGPRQIEALVQPILSGEADLTLGLRVRDHNRFGTAFVHARLGNRIVLALVRVLFGHRFDDLPPFRAVRFDRLLELGMDDRNWGWTLQMQIRAAQRGLRIVTVPVEHGKRRAGRSKISGSVLGTLRAGSKMFYTLARERWRAARGRGRSTTRGGGAPTRD
ncbi:MAG: glycosyltransferase family 2 protein [Gemmatimonadetes bacterium]|nr:MAG: glycosyltransferase family 2 protein [Gemmatimonadota bacterium]